MPQALVVEPTSRTATSSTAQAPRETNRRETDINSSSQHYVPEQAADDQCDAVRRVLVRQMCRRRTSATSGSTVISPNRTAQCRCGPVTRPVAPDSTERRRPARPTVPGCDVDAREMREQREHAEAVIDDDGVPSEIEVPSQHDAAGVRSVNGRSRRGTEVRALMTAGGLAVGDRQSAEAAVAVRLAPEHQRSAPADVRASRIANASAIAWASSLMRASSLSGGFAIFGSTLKPSRLESIPFDDERHLRGGACATCGRSLNRERGRSRGRFEIDAGEAVPLSGGRPGPEAHRPSRSLASERAEILRESSQR